MKKVFHKISAVCMAFVVMFTAMSFTLDAHYCGDTLVDFSIFQETETCGMEKMQMPESGKDSLSEKSCCSDEQLVVEGQDDLKTSFEQLTLEQQTFVASFVYSYINLFEGMDENIVPFKDYSPPYLIQDVQILHETYLI
ncbi:MAG: HYC_CC_PP family protein [Thalassotalea sp.]